MSSWLDRIVLWRTPPISEEVISKHPRITVFETDNLTIPIVLKFSYPGNVQYHRLSGPNADTLAAKLMMLREKGIET